MYRQVKPGRRGLCPEAEIPTKPPQPCEKLAGPLFHPFAFGWVLSEGGWREKGGRTLAWLGKSTSSPELWREVAEPFSPQARLPGDDGKLQCEAARWHPAGER